MAVVVMVVMVEQLQVKPSRKNGQPKDKYPPTPGRPKKGKQNNEQVKREVGRCMRPVVTDEGGNESQGCRLGAKTNASQGFK